mgnify:FL=1
MNRCKWCCDNGINQKYHDEEWGIPLHDDKRHFEYILMEVMQCGLNWTMMLKKRDIFRKCFSNFEVKAVAGLGEEEIDQILQAEGMIKSRRKIDAIINNAKCFLAVVEEFGSFDQYIWSFSNHQILVYKKHQEGQLEASNELSDQLSKDLKKRGVKFLGSITVFSHLQACGIINDHEPECWMYEVVNSKGDVKYME